MPNFQNINISTVTFVKFIGVLLLLTLLYVVKDIVAALLFAIIVASAVEPGIEWLKERRVPRILGVIVMYLGFALVFFLAIYLVVPLLFDEIRTISTSYPELQQQVLSALESFGKPLLPFLGNNAGDILQVPDEYVQKLGGGIFNFASFFFGGIVSFFLIVVFSFYLAAQEKGIETFLRLVTPVRYEPYLIDLWGRSQKKLGRWFRAQLLLGAVVGVLIFFGLTFLGVRNAFFFAILAAIFEIIPVVGPILAAVPAVAVAFFSSPLLGLLVLALYVVVQQLESHVIVPVVMRKTVGLSPLIVVLALLVGVKIGGIFGILLSVPITAILAEFINDWDKKKRELIPE